MTAKSCYCALFYYHELWDARLPKGVTRTHCKRDGYDYWVASASDRGALELLLSSFKEEDTIETGYGKTHEFKRQTWIDHRQCPRPQSQAH